MYRLSMNIPRYRMISEQTWATLEEAVRAQIENDSRNYFAVVQKKGAEGWETLEPSSYLGLKIRLQAEK